MERSLLTELYFNQKLSMKQIAEKLDISVHKVEYWMDKYKIDRRSISEALFRRKHGTADGFCIKRGMTSKDTVLFGLGLGLYWGEGNKKNLHTVRLGNTDPLLIQTFVQFLVEICGVSKESIRYGLQLFTDVDEQVALDFWQNHLNITRKSIMPTVNRIKSGKIGTYKVKNQFGVITVYVFNKRLRDWLVGQLIVPR